MPAKEEEKGDEKMVTGKRQLMTRKEAPAKPRGGQVRTSKAGVIATGVSRRRRAVAEVAVTWPP